MKKNKSLLILASVTLSLICTTVALTPLQAKGAAKKGAVAKGGAKAREKKLLAMKADYPEFYAVKRPEFFVRGSVSQITKSEDGKTINITVLPIEILKNPNHFLKMSHFKDGVQITVDAKTAGQKDLVVGGVLEYNYYTLEIAGQTKGAAQLISEEVHEEFKPYNVAPVAYLTKVDMEAEQQLNALKGANLYSGSIENSPELKAALAKLSKSKNTLVNQEAKKLAAKLK